MSQHEEHPDDGLTDQERAALSIVEKPETEAEGEPQPEAEPEVEPQPEPEAEPAPEPEPQPEAEPKPEPEPKVEVAPVEQPRAPNAPILIATAPEDAQTKLAEIAKQKDELAQKCDDGLITMAQYQKDLDALNEQQFDIKSQLREAELAQKMEQQRIQNAWIADCNAFLNTHAEYKEGSPTFDEERRNLLDAALMSLAKIPANQGMDNNAALAKAHKMVKGAYGEVDVAAPAPQPKPAQPKVPQPAAMPDIGKLPVAQMNDTSGGEFAALEALRKSGDVERYEAALDALSDAAKARYLRT
jgi:hypothetical protein